MEIWEHEQKFDSNFKIKIITWGILIKFITKLLIINEKNK